MDPMRIQSDDRTPVQTINAASMLLIASGVNRLFTVKYSRGISWIVKTGRILVVTEKMGEKDRESSNAHYSMVQRAGLIAESVRNIDLSCQQQYQ
jgi:hypothetical protein